MLKLLVMNSNILSYQIFESYCHLSQNRFRYGMQCQENRIDQNPQFKNSKTQIQECEFKLNWPHPKGSWIGDWIRMTGKIICWIEIERNPHMLFVWWTVFLLN